MNLTPRLLFSLTAAVSAVGCAGYESAAPETTLGADEITSVQHSSVKRQSIGNCWAYAFASWMESTNMRATGVERNFSESYISYWHAFEAITGGLRGTKYQTGGSYEKAADLVSKYGVVDEGTFAPAEGSLEMSAMQKAAEAAINASLASGALSVQSARANRALVRAELNRAFGLSPAVVSKLDSTFGADASRPLTATAATLGIFRTASIPAATTRASTGAVVRTTLAGLIGSGSSWDRSGPNAFQRVDMPYDGRSRRAFWKRVQKALHHKAPAVVEWHVDFNALTTDSKFSLQQLQSRGPGRAGGHMVVAHDYQARTATGRLFAAGVDVTNPSDFDTLLRNDTKVEFLRVKNSWGANRPDRWSTSAIGGYHDLYLDYLQAELTTCEELPNGDPDLSNCDGTDTGLSAIYLPAGY